MANIPGKLGRDEGSDRGPEPGDGATVANPAAGNSDMEGTPLDALPDYGGAGRPDDVPAKDSQHAERG